MDARRLDCVIILSIRKELLLSNETIFNIMSRSCALLVCALDGLRKSNHVLGFANILLLSVFTQSFLIRWFRTSGMMTQTYQHTLSSCVRPSNGQQLIIDIRICTDAAPRLQKNLNSTVVSKKFSRVTTAVATVLFCRGPNLGPRNGLCSARMGLIGPGVSQREAKTSKLLTISISSCFCKRACAARC